MKILKHESPTCRIVQKRSSMSSLFMIVRQRLIKKIFFGYVFKFWKQTAWTYTKPGKSLESYIEYLDWYETSERDRIGSKQF